MPLFVCDGCGCVENTALSRGDHGYWGSIRRDRRHLSPPALCSACNPDQGEWHGRFPREQWDGEREVLNRPTRATGDPDEPGGSTQQPDGP